MALLGHDNVRAAMIYQHAVREATKLITESIDKHLIGREPARDDEDDPPNLPVPSGRSPDLMARRDQQTRKHQTPGTESIGLPGLSQ
ncbi:hypothetical protein ETD86_51785 [Nonomuraea turkmeniaca]|uniref:Uncharacterized protein n=1 Tax=Nonomuraea turkmeniaca TaxID=103838 RepID=A0A5S4EVG7_9ACTN|nr:hypothetical protein [Nonomuraea turkmeniaca]TMR07305.1 hypothetical protein ETD86_51785 [Nonomuraea turkmeniaca]